jgi:SAM-dependent methyltransferase
VIPADDLFRSWFAALESRQLSRLTFAEVRRGLQALSLLYVERPRGLAAGTALEGAGKRAAFALFYAPLHFLLVREVARALRAADPAPRVISDLGCGTGAAGAAWATLAAGPCRVTGVERSGWAVDEARWNYGVLGVRGRAIRADLGKAVLPGRRGGIVAAFTVNELDEETRGRLLERLLAAARRQARILVVEPIARRPFPWWDAWVDAFLAAGGRADLWRFQVDLPERLRLLDRAAGMDHRDLTGRSLWLDGDAAGPAQGGSLTGGAPKA